MDAVIVENYFGDRDDVIAVCDYLRSDAKDVVFGVNVLGDDWHAFSIANEFGARFVQLDSVVGHCLQGETRISRPGWRRNAPPPVQPFSVACASRSQPYLSGRSLSGLAPWGCAGDGIVVTGEGTGRETHSVRSRSSAASSVPPSH